MIEPVCVGPCDSVGLVDCAGLVALCQQQVTGDYCNFLAAEIQSSTNSKCDTAGHICPTENPEVFWVQFGNPGNLPWPPSPTHWHGGGKGSQSNVSSAATSGYSLL